MGLGVRLGDGLADVDLDDPVAREVAPWLLPPPLAISGRAPSPRSHWWYRLDADSGGQAKCGTHVRGDGATLIELRADRLHQTAVLPTVHPSGETVYWRGEAWGGAAGRSRVVGPGRVKGRPDQSQDLTTSTRGGLPARTREGDPLPGN